MGHGIILAVLLALGLVDLSLFLYIYICLYIYIYIEGGDWRTPHTQPWAKVTSGYFQQFSFATENPYAQSK